MKKIKKLIKLFFANKKLLAIGLLSIISITILSIVVFKTIHNNHIKNAISLATANDINKVESDNIPNFKDVNTTDVIDSDVTENTSEDIKESEINNQEAVNIKTNINENNSKKIIDSSDSNNNNSTPNSSNNTDENITPKYDINMPEASNINNEPSVINLFDVNGKPIKIGDYLKSINGDNYFLVVNSDNYTPENSLKACTINLNTGNTIDAGVYIIETNSKEFKIVNYNDIPIQKEEINNLTTLKDKNGTIIKIGDKLKHLSSNIAFIVQEDSNNIMIISEDGQQGGMLTENESTNFIIL